MEIWTAFKQGDRQAFDDLFRRFYPILTRYGSRICADPVALEDLIHDLFIETWQSRSNPAVLSVTAYLLKALKYKLYKHLRKPAAGHATAALNDDTGFVPGHDHHLAEQETHTQMNRRITDAVNRLPDRQKEIVFLKVYQGLSYDEISEVMNINYQVARNLFSQSIRSLRSSMGKAEPY